MTLSDRQWSFLKDLALLIQYADRRGWKLTGGELWRTLDQQKIYYREGKSSTLQSRHMKRMAIDLNLFIDGEYKPDSSDYKELGEFWESLNEFNRWGGNWNDGNHFERL